MENFYVEIVQRLNLAGLHDSRIDEIGMSRLNWIGWNSIEKILA